MAKTDFKNKLLPLHDLINVNTVLGMLYDENGVYRADFEPSVFYNTILLDTLKYGEENFVHLKYAENLSIRKGENVARFRRWAGMTPTLTPLREGVPPAKDMHAYETIEVGNVFSFGRWSEYTDRIDLSIVSDIISERALQYGEVANQTKELYARKTWLSAPNEFYANFKEGFGALTFGDEIQLDDLRFLIARMKRMLVKPIGGKFNYICSPEFINGLIDDPRVKQYMSIEQTTGRLWGTGEPFDMFELSFIPTMLDEFAYPDIEFPGVYELADGKEAIRLYAIDENSVYYLDIHESFEVKTNVTAKVTDSGVSYLADGSAIENRVTWEIPLEDATELTTSNTQSTGEPTSTKVTLRVATRTTGANADGTRKITYGDLGAVDADGLTAVNALIASGAFMQLPVHRGILFGAEAMVKLNTEGVSDQPKIIVKALGSSGVADPIDQRQSVGFKVDGFGLAIKRPEAVCITYSIPKYAELAALTTAAMTYDWTRLDGLKDDDAYDNHIAAEGHGVLRVDGVNLGGVAGEDAKFGTKTVKNKLEKNALDTANDPKSNTK
jgi:hypothetical protein